MSKTSDLLSAIPAPLLRWIESQAALPPAFKNATTFYEAAKLAHEMRFRRKIDRYILLHNWTTIALIADVRTRKYMAKLIRDENEGLHWIMCTGRATRAAMEELDNKDTVSPKRLFRQRRDAILKGLRSSRENLDALEINFPLRDLLIGPDVRKFRRVVVQFTKADYERRSRLGHRAREKVLAEGASAGEVLSASFSGMLKAHGNDVPGLVEMIRAAETAIANLTDPPVERHGARSRYLREMFSALRFGAIAKERIAFVTYAGEAVFGEHIEKRDVRRLMSDLSSEEKECDNLFELMG